MRLPRLDPEKQDIDYGAAEAMVDRAIAAGVNYFDTAYPYHEGKSEPFIGHALRKYPREAVYLADKLPVRQITSPEDIDRIFDEQLARCGVEYFDFYLAHNLNRDNYVIHEKNNVYTRLKRKQEQGLIRHLGFSFHDHTALLRRIVADYEWDFAQIQLNYLDWEGLDAKGQYETLAERGLPVVVMEPVRGGALATLSEAAQDELDKAAPGASAASWAIRYAASLPGVMTVLSGMSTMEQVEDNIRTMTDFHPLSEEEYAVIARAAALYRAAGAIPCTGCRYCMDCPSGVDIPRVFSAYNTFRTTDSKMRFTIDYRSLDEGQQAHNCIACGACLEHCPQGIAIPAMMEMVREAAASL